MRLLTVTLALVVGATGVAVAGPSPDPSPTTYWQIRGCSHHHLEKKASNEITERLKSGLVLTRARWKQVWHFTVCVKYRSSHLRLRKQVKRQMSWRRSHGYELRSMRFALLVRTIPSWGMDHLNSIAWCESRNNPRAVGGGGAYRGLYQFSFSTWRVVGGFGDPAAAPPSEQTWRAWKLLSQYGSGHWPVCG